MTWSQRYRLRHLADTSLVLWATLALIAALVAAPIVRSINQDNGWVLFHYSPDGARAILGALSGSMLTFLVFVLSATLIVVQLASGQLTPRVIALVLAKPVVKLTLCSLTFTYTYTLAALGRVDDHVPHLHVSIAVFLSLMCILVFFLFVQNLSSGLRPGLLMLYVGDRALRVFEQVYPQLYDPTRPEKDTLAVLPSTPVQSVEFTGWSGVVMAFSAAELALVAKDAEAIIELLPQVGDSVTNGDVLFRVYGPRPISTAALKGCVAVGAERTLDQDPRFAFRILVDIANKALSPAINDPTTAVLVLDQIENLLLCLGRRRLDEGVSRDGEGKLRAVYGTPDWPDYVTLAVSEIRHFGVGSIQVNRRLRAMLEHLMKQLPEARWPALQEELALLGCSVRRSFQDEVDRKRAEVADYQGVGGSDS